MTLPDAIAQARSVGVALSNTTITNACDVLSDPLSTRSQKNAACATLVYENDNHVLGNPTYEWTFFDAVDFICNTVNPNGPKATRPH